MFSSLMLKLKNPTFPQLELHTNPVSFSLELTVYANGGSDLFYSVLERYLKGLPDLHQTTRHGDQGDYIYPPGPYKNNTRIRVKFCSENEFPRN